MPLKGYKQEKNHAVNGGLRGLSVWQMFLKPSTFSLYYLVTHSFNEQSFN